MHEDRKLVMVLALAAGACESHELELDADVGERSVELTTELAEEIHDGACPDYRQIARTEPETPCPDVFGWSVSPVFADAPPGELREFCRYLWTDAPEELTLEGLEKHPALVAVAPDCEGVFGQTTDALWLETHADAKALFHHAIGRASAADLARPSSESSRSPVIVAVVDSVPEPAPLDPRSEHGELVAGVVLDIACPGPMVDCAVEVKRALGLPRYANGLIDTTNGGYYGSQMDVARAIYTTVAIWESTNWGPEIPKLIINLSIGWEGELFGDLQASPPRPAVDAVYDALQYARCHGALIIASAGNQGHLCETGPLLPGAWEQAAAPDTARCAELGAPTPPTGPGYEPLLYSVGGVTLDDQPMPGARAGGMPRLAAPASHAVASGNSTLFTGTSAAAAVTTGAAALVWSYNPHLSPATVMTDVYATANPLPLTADYVGPNASATGVRVVDVCDALEQACNRPLSTCPAIPFAAPLACLAAPAPVTNDDLFDALAQIVPDLTATRLFATASPCPDECGGVPTSGHASGQGGACPIPIDPALPFTTPQPSQIGCPNCTLDVSTGVLLATVDPDYDGVAIDDVIVEVHDAAGPVYFGLGPVALEVDEITQIQLDPTLMPAGVLSAEISITFAGMLPVTNSLRIND